MRQEIDPEIEKWLVAHDCRVEVCGSQVTCDPPPPASDTDYLVEIVRPEDLYHSFSTPQCALEGQVSVVIAYLTNAGFFLEGRDHYQHMTSSTFASLRRERVNIILTSNPEFARRHRAATHICTRLNVLAKPDRVAIFQAVLYGNIIEGKTNG